MRVSLIYTFIVRGSEQPAPDFAPIHKRFIDSYKKFYPTTPHEFIVALYGGELTSEIKAQFDGLDVRFVCYNGGGFDCGVAQSVGGMLTSDFVICLNTQCHFYRDGWMERFVEAYQKHGFGLYGFSGSYENSPHLRAPCMAFPPSFMRAYPYKITNRAEAYSFESGGWNLTQWARSCGYKTLMVTWDGEYDQPDWRKPNNVFRRADQSNCLLWERHTKLYADEKDPARKLELERAADGLLNRTPGPTFRAASKKSITVVATTSRGFASHITAINRTVEAIPHKCQKLMIGPKSPGHSFDGKWIEIPEWMPGGSWTLEKMCDFLMFGLHKYIETDVAILVHWDGYAINPQHWTDEFLEYDYIGAPWPKHFTPMGGKPIRVGNGGFSLRSKKWLELSSKLAQPAGKWVAEDWWQCGPNLPHFTSNGCKVAPIPLALKFSYESPLEDYPKWKLSDSFGFHGLVKIDPARRKYRLPSSENEVINRCFHTGDMGDIVAFLPVLRYIRGGDLVLGNSSKPVPRFNHPRERMTAERVAFLKPLLEIQPYVKSVTHQDDCQTADIDMTRFRSDEKYIRTSSLTQWQARYAVRSEVDVSPWLKVEPSFETRGMTLIARSPRYHNPRFNWKKILRGVSNPMFVGLPDEHALFCKQVMPVPHLKVSDALELARAIAGCDKFIGNQSLPCWIAMGLGHPLVQESWPSNPNSRIVRDNAVFVV